MTMQSVRDSINSKQRDGKIIRIIFIGCFEIYGFDFMLDASYRVWLIEVNTNPCIEESSKLLK